MTPEKRLYTKLKEVARSKHPNYPENLTLPGKVYRLNTANGLTQAVIAWIEAHGQRAIRVSSAGRYIDKSFEFTDTVGFRRRVNSGQWVPGTTKVGAADISCTIYGKSVEIEIKIGRDVQSPAQKKYQQIVENSGGIYLIVTCIDDLFKWWDENLVLTK
jgi:hypothetical protein